MADLRHLLIYGAGGYGRVVAETALRAGFQLLGFLDDAVPIARRRVLGFPLFAADAWLSQRSNSGFVVALALGDNRDRWDAAARLRSHGVAIVSVISLDAVVSSSASIGVGSVVMPGVIVSAGAVIEEGVILNTGSIVEHDACVGSFSHVSPRAVLGGGARVGAMTQIGTSATVFPFVTVGSGSIVGGGSVVPRDIPADVVAFGCPARVRRQIAERACESSQVKVATAKGA